MKQILIWVLTLITSICYSQQTVIPFAGFRGEIVNMASVSTDVLRVTVNINDETGKANGTFVYEGGDWVLWQDCRRYTITSTTCLNCSLYNTEITVQITRLSGDPFPTSGFCVIVQESALDIAGFVSGAQFPELQCMGSYYVNKITSSIDNAEDIACTVGGTAPASTVATVSGYRFAVNNSCATNGTLYYWDGDSWEIVGSGGGGGNTVTGGSYNPLTNSVVLTMTTPPNITYSHNEVLYNNGSLSGTATHHVGVDYTNGRLYYRDNTTGNWALATVNAALTATNATNAGFATLSQNVNDGDFGDISVASSVWDIDANTIGSSELIATGTPTGTFGDGSTVPQITVDADGRITNIVGVAVSGGGGGAAQYITVADRAALISSTAGYSIAYVTNSTYGGWFYKITNGTVNGGTVLQGNGTDEWLRMFNNEIDPKWWLGDGTNQTADDDIDAFNKAVTFAGSASDPNKYQIALNPKLVYAFTSVGTVDSVSISSGIRNLVIDGKGASIQMGPNQPVGFSVMNAQRVTFKNINFTGNGEYSGTGDFKNIFPSTSTEGTFIRFNDNNCGDNRIENCTFTKFNAYAIDILKLAGSTAYFKGVTVKDCFFFEAEIDPKTWKQFCIKLGQWAEYCIIENNKFEKVPRIAWAASNGANTWYNNNMASNLLGQQQRDNAIATATVGGGVITAITVTWAGNGYRGTPTVYIYDAGGAGTGATATAVMNAYSGVYSVTVNTGGSGYVSPVVAFETNFGAVVGAYYFAHRQFQAVASVVVSGGAITSINQTYKGLGYTSIPTISIPAGAGGGTGGALTGTLDTEGGLTITVASGGSGYTNGTYNISTITGGGSPRTNAGKMQIVGGKYNHIEHGASGKTTLGGSPLVSIIDNESVPARNRQLTMTNVEALVVGDNGGTSTVINVTVIGGVVQPTATIVTANNMGYVTETLYAKVPGTYTTPARFSFTADGDGKITGVTVLSGGTGYSTSGTQALILSQDPTNENSSTIVTSFNCYTTIANSTFQGKGNKYGALDFYKVDSIMLANVDINGGEYSAQFDNCPGIKINWATVVTTEATVRPWNLINGSTFYNPGATVNVGTSITGNGGVTALEVNIQKGTGSGLTGVGTTGSPLQLTIISDPLRLSGNGTTASPLRTIDKFTYSQLFATNAVTLTVASTDAFIRVPKAWNSLKIKKISTGFGVAGTGTNTVTYTVGEAGFTTTDIGTTNMGTTVETQLDSVCTQIFTGMKITPKVTAIGGTAPKGLFSTFELTSGNCTITDVANFVPIAQYGTVLTALGANKPSLAIQLKQNALVTELVNAGIWAKLDALYLFDANNQIASNVNFILPGTGNAVPSGANVVWTSGSGYSVSVTNSNTDMVTLRDPDGSGSVIMADTSMSVGVWVNYDDPATSRIFNDNKIKLTFGTNNVVQYIGNNANISSGITTTGADLTTATRFKCLVRDENLSSALGGNFALYNGSTLSTRTSTLVSPIATTFSLFGHTTNYAGTIQAAWIGDEFWDAQITILRNALKTYFTP